MEQVARTDDTRQIAIAFLDAGVGSNASPLTVTSFASAAVSHWQISMPAAEVDWLEFTLLARQWKRETGHLSSRPQKTSSRFYRRIIEMGKDRAVPEIIRQLREEGGTPSHWWPALQELTNENPVPDDASGDLSQVAKYWLEWGRTNYGRELGPR